MQDKQINATFVASTVSRF